MTTYRYAAWRRSSPCSIFCTRGFPSRSRSKLFDTLYTLWPGKLRFARLSVTFSGEFTRGIGLANPSFWETRVRSWSSSLWFFSMARHIASDGMPAGRSSQRALWWLKRDQPVSTNPPKECLLPSWKKERKWRWLWDGTQVTTFEHRRTPASPQ